MQAMIIDDIYLVDGGWTLWKNSTECSQSCGGGKIQLNRSCTNPLPQCGGAECMGINNKTVSCNEQCCPGMRYNALYFD